MVSLLYCHSADASPQHYPKHPQPHQGCQGSQWGAAVCIHPPGAAFVQIVNFNCKVKCGSEEMCYEKFPKCEFKREVMSSESSVILESEPIRGFRVTSMCEIKPNSGSKLTRKKPDEHW